MPERLYIPQTDDTPEMEFDIEKPSFTISGRAFPENAHATFITVFRWLEEYKKNPKPLMIVDFKLIGYNTASAKQIMKLIILLEEFLEKTEVIINWYYRYDDLDTYDSGRQFASMTKIRFNYIKITKDSSLRSE